MPAKASKKPAKKAAPKKPAAKAAPASQPAPTPAAAAPAPTQVPAVIPPAPAAPAVPAAPPKPAAPAVKILIIDDDPFLSGMYATRLVNDGFTVVTAMDGMAGLEMAAAEMPDVILLDVMMPKMDGFETLRLLKRSPTLSKIPVLMLTSMAQREDVELGLRGGAADYLLKAQTLPIDASEKIKKVLREKK
ncbi:MAG TPA: response regulator [Candidatus Binatia bacterium]|nr:response regulator [Candidatus Binatia bacterium]